MKNILKNKLNLFLFFILLINILYIKNISYFELEILKNSFNINWIPTYSIYRQEVIESKYLLDKNKIKKFNLSEKIIGPGSNYCCKSTEAVDESDKYTFFRTITYNFPSRFDLKSKYFLFYKNEETSKECKEIDEGKYLKLLKC